MKKIIKAVQMIKNHSHPDPKNPGRFIILKTDQEVGYREGFSPEQLEYLCKIKVAAEIKELSLIVPDENEKPRAIPKKEVKEAKEEPLNKTLDELLKNTI